MREQGVVPDVVGPAKTRAAGVQAAWRRNHWGVLAAAVLLLVAAGLYLPGFPRGPVMDDTSVFSENPAVRSAGDWLTSAFFADTYRPIWRPLTVLTYRWNWSIWPGGRRPAAIVNLVLLTLAALLFTGLLRSLGLRRYIALGAGVLFLVQPVAVESVARLAGRSELLCICFMLAAMWMHTVWSRRDEAVTPTRLAARWALWGVCFLCALLSKEIALVLPLLAVALELTHAVRGDRRARTWRVAGVVVASAVVITSWAAFRAGVLNGWPHQIKRNPAPDYVSALTAPERVRFALALPVHYGGILIGANEQLPDYSHLLAWPEEAPPVELGNPHSFGVGLPAWPLTVVGVALLAGALVIYWTQRRRRPALALGAGWAAATLLATLPILRSNGHVASVRDLLLPLLGLVMMIAALADPFLAERTAKGETTPLPSATRRRRAVVVGLALIVVIVSVVRTRAELPTWQSQDVLMSHLEKQAPQSPEVALYRGLLAIRGGDLEHATAQMERSVSLFPRNPRTLLNLGMLYRNQGRSSVAGRVLSDAVTVAEQLAPRTAVESQAHVALGSFLGEQDQQEAALEQYLKAVAADSTNFQALARAGALQAMRYPTAREGIRLIQRALALDHTGALGPLGQHIRETADRAERYLRVLDGDARSYEQNMVPDQGQETGQPKEAEPAAPPGETSRRAR
jgi:Tfp pilus assembly protein PilF